MRRVLRRSAAIGMTAFGLACADTPATAPPAGHGAIRISNTTTGPLIPGPGYFHVAVDSASPLVLFHDSVRIVDPVAVGPHRLTLDLLRPQCAVGDTSPSVSVQSGDTATVDFHVTCQNIYGVLRVDLPTSGPDQPSTLTVTLDGSAIGGASPNTAGLGFPYVTAGPHAVGVQGAGSNCAIAEPNPQDVTVPLGDSVLVTFTLTCT
jgi:hypothetical protein